MKGEDGSALAVGLLAVTVATVVLVVVVDLAAYLVASGRAQTAADAAALAAVAAADPRGGAAGPAETRAERVARANGARVVSCRCDRPVVEVVAEVEVRALAVTRFAGRRVRATARARLAPPAADRVPWRGG